MGRLVPSFVLAAAWALALPAGAEEGECLPPVFECKPGGGNAHLRDQLATGALADIIDTDWSNWSTSYRGKDCKESAGAALDGNPATSWVAGTEAEAPILLVRLAVDTAVEIFVSEAARAKHARPKDVVVHVIEGGYQENYDCVGGYRELKVVASAPFALDDAKGWQLLPVPPHEALRTPFLALEIRSVYPGPAKSPVAVSEVSARMTPEALAKKRCPLSPDAAKPELVAHETCVRVGMDEAVDFFLAPKKRRDKAGFKKWTKVQAAYKRWAQSTCAVVEEISWTDLETGERLDGTGRGLTEVACRTEMWSHRMLWAQGLARADLTRVESLVAERRDKGQSRQKQLARAKEKAAKLPALAPLTKRIAAAQGGPAQAAKEHCEVLRELADCVPRLSTYFFSLLELPPD